MWEPEEEVDLVSDMETDSQEKDTTTSELLMTSSKLFYTTIPTYALWWQREQVY